MMIGERVEEFVRTWEKRRLGTLPPIDMRVACQSCGVQVMGDVTLQFTGRGLLCGECADKGKDGTGETNLK